VIDLGRIILIFSVMIGCGQSVESQNKENWINKPQHKWPQISMINSIEYQAKSFPVAGCGFLLDTGKDTIAVTAKHILTYFKSEQMNSVSFENSLQTWKMFPKNNPTDFVVIDKMINENEKETIDRIPSKKDWLLFTVKQKSKNIKPLKFRANPLKKGDKVYIIGWRHTDKNCPQIVYEGNFVKYDNGTILFSTKKLQDNKMPGLSGSPVIDSNGCLIGLMSQKAGKMERASSIEHPMSLLENK